MGCCSARAGAVPGAVCLQGTAVNQDGRSASFMAPHGPSQEEVIQAAIRVASLSGAPASIEAHGTGTALGDPIEMGALQRVLVWAEQARPAVILALKSQIAHSEGAAGIAGLIKIATTVRHVCSTPNLQLRNDKPEVSIKSFAVCTPSQIQSDVSDACIAGVSSFGFSGTNSHAIVLMNDVQRQTAHSVSTSDNGKIPAQ